MLLAGVLAIGSAFTTKIHRAPCDGLTQVHLQSPNQPYPPGTLGDCNGDDNTCFYGDLGNGNYISCDDGLGTFIPR